VTTVDPLVIKLTADVNDLKAGLAQAQSAIKGVDDNIKTASSGMANFVTKLKQVGATLGVAFAGQQVLQFGKDVIMASSNMAESLGKMNVVFGENATVVEGWANKSATSMGLSKQAAVEAAGTYGNLFQAFGLGQDKATDMSTSLVQLASDMASFNNTSIDDAILALRSGLSGETEPLKKFGVALSDARLKTEAMSMGLIKSTSEALTPAAKAQASYSLIMKDTKLAQGDYARTADGTANTMRTLKAQFDNAKVALGDALMPAFRGVLAVLKLLIPVLNTIGEFFKKYQGDIMAVAKVVAIAGGAFLAYKGIMIATAVGSEVLAVATTILKGQQLASIASTNGLAASMLALNAAMRANPVGLIITGITLAVAAIVLLWKHSEAFRKLVITVGKAGLMAFAAIIPMVGQVYEAIFKVTSGPLRLLLTALSHLPGVGKYAKAGLDLMNKGLDGISDFADGAAKKAKELAASLDNVGKEADKSAKKTKEAVKTTTDGTGGTGKGGGLSAKDQKALDKYSKQVTTIYKEMNDTIKSYNDDAAKELDDYNQKKLDAHKKYDEEYASLTKKKGEADAADQKRYDEAVFNIEADYAKKKISLERDLAYKTEDIRQKAADKAAELTKNAAEKQASIIQSSIDRLRNAFASKTGFSISEAFTGGATSADKLLEELKAKLAGAKELQKNAAALAGLGYSQVFIEEVVKNGPEAGNKIAEALKAASPEATKELQSLYGQVETTSAHGLDALANTMNAGGKLATEELMTAFNQVSVDLKQALSVVNTEMNASLADANRGFNDSMAEAMVTRNEALADAKKTLTEALAANKKAFDEGLAASQKDLDDALIKAQESYNKAIDELNAKTQKKLEDLKAKLKEVADQMVALGAAQAAAAAMANAPTATFIGTPFGQAGSATNPATGLSGAEATARAVSATTINQTFVSTAAPNPQTVAAATVSASKYGTVVTPIPVSAAKLKMMERLL
jgi:hypothetical protein